MYLISLILFLVVLVLTFSFGNAPLSYLIDNVSLLLLLLALIPIIIASGLEKDLIRALSIAVRKSVSYSLKQLRRCEEALSLTIKLLLYSGILFFFLQLIILLQINPLPEQTWTEILSANLSVAALSIVYPLLFCCLLLPIRSRIRGEIINQQSMD